MEIHPQDRILLLSGKGSYDSINKPCDDFKHLDVKGCVKKTGDVTCCNDVITDGLNGILCNPQNARSFEIALRKMLALTNVEKNEKIKNGRIKVKKEFENRL